MPNSPAPALKVKRWLVGLERRFGLSAKDPLAVPSSSCAHAADAGLAGGFLKGLAKDSWL